jgi:hypothetical protein
MRPKRPRVSAYGEAASAASCSGRSPPRPVGVPRGPTGRLLNQQRLPIRGASRLDINQRVRPRERGRQVSNASSVSEQHGPPNAGRTRRRNQPTSFRPRPPGAPNRRSDGAPDGALERADLQERRTNAPPQRPLCVKRSCSACCACRGRSRGADSVASRGRLPLARQPAP